MRFLKNEWKGLLLLFPSIFDTVDGHKAVETSEAILASEHKESDNTIYDDHWHQAEIHDEPRFIHSDASVQFSDTCISLIALLFLPPCLRKPLRLKNLDKMTSKSVLLLVVSASMY